MEIVRLNESMKMLNEFEKMSIVTGFEKLLPIT